MNNETKVNEKLQLFKERLRDLRGSKSLKEVAQDLEISRATLGYYENGDRKPDIEILIKIANYYNVSSDYLLGLTDVSSPQIDDRTISEKTGLTEYALQALYGYGNSEFMDEHLELLTINLLLSNYPHILNLITMYLFTNFESACEVEEIDQDNAKISSHQLSTIGKMPQKQIPLSQLGFVDRKLKFININRNKDFFLNAYLLELQKELSEARNELGVSTRKNIEKTIDMILNANNPILK